MLLSILFCALPLWVADDVAPVNVAPESWVASGRGATLDIRDGALTLHYDAREGARDTALLPLGNFPMTEMKSLRFEIRTDAPFAAAVLLSEKVLGEKKPGGGNYMAAIWSSGDKWQPVVLAPGDFTEAEGARAPEDPDRRLGLDRLRNLALLDLTLFTSGAARNERVYAEPHTGPHTISIRNVEISREAAPPRASGMIDDFSRPQLAWFTGGGATLVKRDAALTVDYRQLPRRWVAWSRLLPPGDYAGATRLAMDIQSDRDAQLAISVREPRADGSPGKRYNVDFLVAGGKSPEHREVVLRAFHAEDGGGGLNPALLRTITFLDVSGESGRNQIRIGNLRLVN